MSTDKRYSRQTVLPEIGMAGQEKISAARVLVVGAGGLGCPALLYLAAAGVGTIGIVDFDRVDASNLQRQILFKIGDQGKSKSAAAKDGLLALNPAININAHDEQLTDKNVIGLFSGYDIILDGTDNFSAKFLINDAAVKLGKPVVYGAIQGFEGQVSVFNDRGGPCYRCLHPKPPQTPVMNCAESGVIGALAGMTGTVQAMETIKLIVRHESFKPLSGILWMIDTRTMETNMISIPKRPDCPVCSQPAANIIPQYASPVCAATQVTEITCADAEQLKGASFVDVRESEEWDAGHIAGAHHLPLSALRANPELFKPFSKNTPCVIYCQRGRRSFMATEILLQAGFTGLYSMTGGFEAWNSR